MRARLAGDSIQVWPSRMGSCHLLSLVSPSKNTRREDTYSTGVPSPSFIQESITLRFSDGNERMGSVRCSPIDSTVPCSTTIDLLFSPPRVASIVGLIVVEGRTEMALSLLELSVIVDDSARDDDDCVGCCCCRLIESIIDDDDDDSMD